MKRLALFALLAWPGLALAGPDFSGHWLLDEDASGSMDTVLKLQEVSWAKRQLAETLDNEQRIVQSEAGLTVTFDNLLGDIEQRLVLDGQPHETVNPAGMKSVLSTRWEGEALVASGPMTTDEGLTGTLTERRTLSADGQTMTLVVTVELPGHGSASTTRVFRKR